MTTPTIVTVKKSHVFFSYARKDGSVVAEKVKRLLTDGGIKMWIDTDLRSPSNTPFSILLEDAISQSFALIALLTPEARASRWARAEWLYALAKEIPVIPVLAPGFDESNFPIDLIGHASRFTLSTDETDFKESMSKICALLEMVRADLSSTSA